MAKLPEYQKSQAIQPQAEQLPVEHAVTQATVGINAIAKVGQQIAIDSANQIGQEYAIKLARENPGAKLLPALTPIDKNFNDIFRQEQFKVLNNQGISAADQINYQYSQILNPTVTDIESYVANMKEAFGNILGMSDEFNHGDLSRSFESMTNTGMYQLMERAQKASFDSMKDTAKITTKNNLNSLINYGRLLDMEGLEQAYMDELENIESTRELFGEAVTNDKIEALNLTKDIGIYGGKLMSLATNQGVEAAAKYLKEFATNIPEGMEPSRHFDVTQQMYKMASAYLKQIGIDQSIENSKAELELDVNEGILPVERWAAIKDKVSPEQYNALLRKSLKAQAAKNQIDDDVSFVVSNNNVQSLSNMSGDRLNKVFDALLSNAQQQAMLKDQEFDANVTASNIASQIKATIPKYKKMLEDTVLFGDAEAAANVGSIIRKLERDNPIAIKGFSKDAMDLSTLYNQFRLNTQLTGAEALQQAKNDIFNVSDEERTRRDGLTAKYMKDYKDKPQKWNDFIGKGIDAPKSGFIGWREYQMPSDVPVIAERLFGSYVRRFGNTQTAEEQMFKDLNSVYVTTTTNHRKEKMAYPPEVALKDNNLAFWSENDKALSLYRFVKANQNATEKPNSFIFNKIEWPDNPFDEWFPGVTFDAEGTIRKDGNIITKHEFYDMLPDAMSLQQMLATNPKLMIDGKLREVIIQADEITRLSADELPSYPFYYLDDNKIPQPIMGIDKAGGDVRWYPNLEILDNQKKRIPRWLQDEANLAYEKALETRSNFISKVEADKLGLSKRTLADISITHGDDLLTEYPVPKKAEKKDIFNEKAIKFEEPK